MNKSERYFHVPYGPMELNYDRLNISKFKDDIYIHNETGEKFRERPMYNFGYGNFYGLERLPKLAFNDLISLIEYRNWSNESTLTRITYDNQIGAAVVIMDDYLDEFIELLNQKINTDYFNSENTRVNYGWFVIHKDRSTSGGMLTKSYRQILKEKKAFLEIDNIITPMLYHPGVVINHPHFLVYKIGEKPPLRSLGLKLRLLTGVYINKKNKIKYRKKTYRDFGIVMYEELSIMSLKKFKEPKFKFEELIKLIIYNKYFDIIISESQIYCSSHMVREDTIIEILSDVIGMTIDNIIDASQIIRKADKVKLGKQIAVQKNRLYSINQTVKKLKKRIAELYTDYKDEILTLEEYHDMKDRFSKDKIELENEVQRIEARTNNLESDSDTYIEPVQKYMQFKDVFAIDRNVLSSLVDEILIDQEKNITVNFKFKDEIREYCNLIF